MSRARLSQQQFAALQKERPKLQWKEVGAGSTLSEDIKRQEGAQKGGKNALSDKVKIPKPTPAGLLHIKNLLLLHKVPFVEELQFDEKTGRKFRFDIAIPELKIAAEFEGLFSDKSRHTTVTGYTTDCDKYTIAAQQGWQVWRYTAMNYKNFNQDILLIISRLKDLTLTQKQGQSE